MPVLTVIDNAMTEFEAAIEELPRVSTKKLGLDVRAGYVYVDLEDECLIADGGSKRSLDYYGGFEYVSEEAVSEFAGYKVYSADSDRVADALAHYEAELEEEVA